MPEKEQIEAFAAHGATMVIFLSAGQLARLSEHPFGHAVPVVYEDDFAVGCPFEVELEVQESVSEGLVQASRELVRR